ncbi:DRTGG domain-containing protein [Acetivibrio cellulolyticus]|uniref:DRTGG domain-containing protein n=1 Tax=Acetivibrio cellulolyticus TaxID=35830 RepID=UPI0001E30504|nr:DRTGG domain-containing protein [Acetivibrio cellulolyticus]
MKIGEFSDLLHMKVLTDAKGLDRDIAGVYIGDLLSWVMSHANKGDVWITVHTHLNIVAVALLVELACIVIPEGIQVEEATIKKANEEGIVILSSGKTAYQLAVEAGHLIGERT